MGEDAFPAVVSGPSFAGEVARGLPTALTVAAIDSDHAARVATWFRDGRTRVYTSTDIRGVQLGGAIKNVMAIAAGISDGLGFGANARAALITRGLAEMSRLGEALGGQADTFMGLTGMGDLILTCTDDQSRNRRVGLAVGQGQNITQALQAIGQEAEGVNTARELHRKSGELKVEMPISEQVYRVLFDGLDPAQAVTALLSREPRAEHN
jgi:glycerol-3-phosphate dehydrogenase (NAD(P)+)